MAALRAARRAGQTFHATLGRTKRQWRGEISAADADAAIGAGFF
jgi:hypothetical protein